MNKTLRVLHVEDSERDVKLLTRHLLRAGYELISQRVETAEGMKAALAEREWDVILCDYAMPHFSALGALTVLKQSGLDIPFIIISGTVGEAAAVEAMRAGAHDYLMKDNLVRLAATIDRELQEAENRRARTRAEEALRTSEAELRALFAAMTDVIIVFDSAGRHLKIAPSRGPLYKPAHERIGKTVHEVFPTKKADFVLKQIRRALEERRIQRVEYSLSMNGEEKWFEGSVSPMSSNTVLWVARDITERKQAADEKARLTAEIESQGQRLDSLVSTVPGVVWEAWGQPNAANQRINFVSDYVETLLGYTVDEWLSTPNFWLSIVHPDDREQAGAEAAAAFALGHSKTLVFRWLTKDGRSIWVESNFVVTKDSQGNPVGLRGVNIDVSERKRTEAVEARRAVHALFRADVSAALARSTSSLRDTLQLCAEAMVLHLNAAFARVWTFNREESVLELQASAGIYTHIDGAHARVPLGSFKIGHIAANRLPHISNSVLNDPEISDKEWAHREQMVAFAGYPLIVEDRLLGVMAMFSREVLEDDTLDALSSVADIVSQAVERKRAEEGLRESEERYRELFESNPYPMWVFDRKTLNFLAVNDSAVFHYGYSREEFLTMTLEDIRPPEEVPRLREDLRRQNGGPGIREWRHRKKDGAIIDVEISSQTLAFGNRPAQLVLALDITARKKAEAALRESEERYRDLVENAHDIIYSHDLEGNYTSVNKAGEVITGYPRAEALKLNLINTVAPEDVDKAKEMLRRKLVGERVTVYEMELIAKDGRRVSVEVNTKLVYQNGMPVGVQGIARDVTERKLLEDQLRQSQKMEAIGQLAGGVAHDFNNLLTAINGYSSLALRRVQDDDPVKGYLEEINKAGERAANLTRQLLAFGRKQMLQPVALNLNDVVADLNKMLRRLIGEDIKLTAKFDPGLKKLKGDPGQIEQVLMNLVVNSRDAMAHGGMLTIETANVELDEEYAARHVGIQPGKYVMLAVSDTGIGMNEETRTRIFEPFFTTKEKGKGTGLGLSTVYGIVKQSGGNIWVYSEPDRGTSFKVYFPQIDDEVERTKKGAVEEPVAGGSETILLVEDEQVVRHLAKDILENAGYKVLSANGGKEATDLCANNEKQIALLLTDVVMPETSGKEVADRICKLVPGVKVLFMSGYTDEAIVHHGVLDSNVEFIQKPFTPSALAKKVREVLDSNGRGKQR